MNMPIEKIKKIDENELLCITHNDLDGVAANVLMRLSIFPKLYNVNIENVSTNEVENTINKWIDEHSSFPGFLIINDLSFMDKDYVEELDKYIKNQPVISAASLLIDHHPTALWLNKYSWCHVKAEKEYGSASYQLFKWMEYNNYITTTIKRLEWISSISRYDTWKWKDSKDFYQDEYENILLDIYGIDYYIDKTISRIRDADPYSSDELKLIQNYIIKRDKKVTSIVEKKIKEVYFKGHAFYLFLTSAPISSVKEKFEEVCPDAKDNIIATLFVDTMVLSMRTSSDDIDLGELAKSLAFEGKGGGHKKAAGCTLSVEDGLELIRRYFS